MFDRGAPCKDYCGKTAAKAARERYGCRSGRFGKRTAGSSENIRAVVALSLLLRRAITYPFYMGVVVAFSAAAFFHP